MTATPETPLPESPLPRDKFLWGVATSAFQTEGAPTADWANWKISGAADREARLRGVGHHERTADDLELVSELGLDAYRFSVSWSRVVPRPGEWVQDEVDRYANIAATLRQKGIEPVVTLHHFAAPAWLAEHGLDWTEDAFVEEFISFATRMVGALCGTVKIWVTLNEPNVHVSGGYLGGMTPPGRIGLRAAHRALVNMLRAHARLYTVIHGLCPGAAVGITHNMLPFRPDRPDSFLDRRAAAILDRLYNQSVLEAFRTGRVTLRLLPFGRIAALPLVGRLDFLGVNYYTRAHVNFTEFHPSRLGYFWEDRTGRGLTETGWEVCPEGFAEVLRAASSLGVPLVITENGTAETDDARKIAFMRDHLEVMRRCRAEGIDIRGYFWWSLLDNYEWLIGLGPRFGLYRVDFTTLERTRTAAADEFAAHAAGRSGTIPGDMGETSRTSDQPAST